MNTITNFYTFIVALVAVAGGVYTLLKFAEFARDAVTRKQELKSKEVTDVQLSNERIKVAEALRDTEVAKANMLSAQRVSDFLTEISILQKALELLQKDGIDKNEKVLGIIAQVKEMLLKVTEAFNEFVMGTAIGKIILSKEKEDSKNNT